MLTGIELLKRLSNGQLPFGLAEENFSGHGSCKAVGGFNASYSYSLEWDGQGKPTATVKSWVYFDTKGNKVPFTECLKRIG
jgi:hypothetical protein